MSPVRTITIDKTEYIPSRPGNGRRLCKQICSQVKVQHAKVRFRNSDELLALHLPLLSSKTSKKQSVLYITPSLAHNMDVNHFGSIITGYINVPEDGVYRLSSLLHKVWVD